MNPHQEGGLDVTFWTQPEMYHGDAAPKCADPCGGGWVLMGKQEQARDPPAPQPSTSPLSSTPETVGLR